MAKWMTETVSCCVTMEEKPELSSSAEKKRRMKEYEKKKRRVLSSTVNILWTVLFTPFCSPKSRGLIKGFRICIWKDFGLSSSELKTKMVAFHVAHSTGAKIVDGTVVEQVSKF